MFYLIEAKSLIILLFRLVVSRHNAVAPTCAVGSLFVEYHLQTVAKVHFCLKLAIFYTITLANSDSLVCIVRDMSTLLEKDGYACIEL